MLEQQYNAIMSQSRLCTIESDRLRSNLSELELRISELSKRETRLVSSTTNLETKIASLKKEIDELQGRRSRAVASVLKLAKEVRKSRDGDIRNDELDVALRTGKDTLAVSVDAIVKSVELNCEANAVKMIEMLRDEVHCFIKLSTGLIWFSRVFTFMGRLDWLLHLSLPPDQHLEPRHMLTLAPKPPDRHLELQVKRPVLFRHHPNVGQP